MPTFLIKILSPTLNTITMTTQGYAKSKGGMLPTVVKRYANPPGPAASDQSNLFHDQTMAEGQDWRSNLNANSLEVLSNARVEPSLRDAKPGEKYQFERLGYFAVDKDLSPQNLVFNRAVTLKDTWAKVEKTGAKAKA